MISMPPIKIGKIGINNSQFSVSSMSPVLWLDASDLSTITKSENAVSQWNDKSGNGYHAKQTIDAAQPTTNTRTLNNKRGCTR